MWRTCQRAEFTLRERSTSGIMVPASSAYPGSRRWDDRSKMPWRISAHQAECDTQQGKMSRQSHAIDEHWPYRRAAPGSRPPRDRTKRFHELALLRQQQGATARGTLPGRTRALDPRAVRWARRIPKLSPPERSTRNCSRNQRPGGGTCAEPPVEPRPRSPRAKTQTAGSVRRKRSPLRLVTPTEPSQAVPANCVFCL